MRFLVNVSIPHRTFNAAMKDGSVSAKMKRIIETIKPEAIYFTEQNGSRGCVMVVDMADASKIPSIAEPWFLTFEADVQFRIAMTPEDLGRANLDQFGPKWG
jgi:hypothetical protein